MCIETLLYSSFGIICYLTFGEYTDQIVLLNFQSYYSASHVHTFLEIILVSYVSTLITTNFVINLPFYDFLGAQFQSVPLLIAGKSVYLLVQLVSIHSSLAHRLPLSAVRDCDQRIRVRLQCDARLCDSFRDFSEQPHVQQKGQGSQFGCSLLRHRGRYDWTSDLIFMTIINYFYQSYV